MNGKVGRSWAGAAWRVAGAAGLSAVLALLAACGSDGGVRAAGLDPEAFRASADHPATAPRNDPRPHPELVKITAAAQVPIDITAKAGSPAIAASAAPSGAPEVIDSKIGDINGHPIWASEFFDPNFSAHLQTDAARMSREDWLRQTRTQIVDHLQGKIENILMTDEGLATLTPEMKEHGLAMFLALWRANQKSRNMGSEVLADRAAQNGQKQYYANLDEQMRAQQEKVLISIMLEKLDHSVNISSADIERYYNKHLDVFDPPPVATFSMISVSSGRAADAAAARWCLEEGAPFADVASMRLNSYKAATAGRMDDRKFTGAYAEADLFPSPAMATAARPLTPGEWTGPFDDGYGNATFLCLDRVEKNTVSLYDAQIFIEDLLHDQEFTARMHERIDGLIRRSSLTDQSEMIRRLMDFAEAKFLPPSG